MEEFAKIIKTDIKCLTKALDSESSYHQQIAMLNPHDNIILNIENFVSMKVLLALSLESGSFFIKSLL